MTDRDKLRRIEKLFEEADIADDYTQDTLFADLENETIANIKDVVWHLYCFAMDVHNTLNIC